MPYVLQVGAMYAPGIHRWPELSYYAWDPAHQPGAHHRLTVFAASPSARELVAFKAGGRLELAFIADGPALVLLWTGAGWPWSDAPFSWHLQAEKGTANPIGVPDVTPVPAWAGVPLDTILVDAATGKVVALRRVAMPGDFATALHRAIAAQAGLAWDHATYDARVQELAAVPCEDLLKRASARCVMGR